MAISKTWSIQGVQVITNLFQMQNVVSTITWKLTLENDGEQMADSSTPPQIVNINGKTQLLLPTDPNSYVPYESVTEDQMKIWLFESLGEKRYEYEKEAETHMVGLLATKVPSITIDELPLPWTNFSGHSGYSGSNGTS